MQRSIRYGDAHIAFSIRFMPKPRRRVSIHLLPEGSIRVDAPDDATPEAVVAAVQRRARWLWKELEAQRERRQHVLPREYVSGESHFYLGRRLAELAPRLPRLSAVPAFRLLNMRTQWGSCSLSGELVLNPQLVKAPRPCIDYVIYHELCHLKVHNHSPEYYRLLEAVMPDWAAHKQMLDGLAEVLLNR